SAEDEDAEDLLGRVRRRADRVRAEDRERLLLREPLADLVLRRQGTADDRGLDAGPQAPERRRRPTGGLLGGELARPAPAEVRGVGALDAHPAVGQLAAIAGSEAAGHRDRVRTGGEHAETRSQGVTRRR